MNDTPDEIQHEGKTLERLPRIEDAREGDWVMISGKLYPVTVHHQENHVKYVQFFKPVNMALIVDVIQAAYREKEAEVHQWWAAQIDSHGDEKEINEYLTEKYGSPTELMRKGAEQAIQLDDWEWAALDKYFNRHGFPNVIMGVMRQALSNCRPKKGGAK